MQGQDLYQIYIGKYWHDVSRLFVVFGFINNEWEAFTIGRNYEFFIGWRL